MGESISSDLDDFFEDSDGIDEGFLNVRAERPDRQKSKAELRRKMEDRLEQRRLSDLLGIDVSDEWTLDSGR